MSGQFLEPSENPLKILTDMKMVCISKHISDSDLINIGTIMFYIAYVHRYVCVHKCMCLCLCVYTCVSLPVESSCTKRCVHMCTHLCAHVQRQTQAYQYTSTQSCAHTGACPLRHAHKQLRVCSDLHALKHMYT